MSHEMEMEDFVTQLRAENASLREELHRAHLAGEAKDREIALLHEAARSATKENLELRKRLQSWADDADEIIARARRSEVEAYEE